MPFSRVPIIDKRHPCYVLYTKCSVWSVEIIVDESKYFDVVHRVCKIFELVVIETRAEEAVTQKHLGYSDCATPTNIIGKT